MKVKLLTYFSNKNTLNGSSANNNFSTRSDREFYEEIDDNFENLNLNQVKNELSSMKLVKFNSVKHIYDKTDVIVENLNLKLERNNKSSIKLVKCDFEKNNLDKNENFSPKLERRKKSSLKLIKCDENNEENFMFRKQNLNLSNFNNSNFVKSSPTTNQHDYDKIFLNYSDSN